VTSGRVGSRVGLVVGVGGEVETTTAGGSSTFAGGRVVATGTVDDDGTVDDTDGSVVLVGSLNFTIAPRAVPSKLCGIG
jgi:hypothetical protein